MSGAKELLFKPTAQVIKSRLKRYEVPIEHQEEFETQRWPLLPSFDVPAEQMALHATYPCLHCLLRMWQYVGKAIEAQDQVAATEEKTKLEEAQRGRAKELKEKNEIHQPKSFEFDPVAGLYAYKHAE